MLQSASTRAISEIPLHANPRLPALVNCHLNTPSGTAMHAAQQQHLVLCINPATSSPLLPALDCRRPAHLAHVADVDGVLAVLGDCERDVAHAAGTPAGRAGGHPHRVTHPGFAHQHALGELLQQLVPCRASKQVRLTDTMLLYTVAPCTSL